MVNFFEVGVYTLFSMVLIWTDYCLIVGARPAGDKLLPAGRAPTGTNGGAVSNYMPVYRKTQGFRRIN